MIWTTEQHQELSQVLKEFPLVRPAIVAYFDYEAARLRKFATEALASIPPNNALATNYAIRAQQLSRTINDLDSALQAYAGPTGQEGE